MNDVSVGVRQYLELDMMRIDDELLEIHLVIVKARARFGTSLLEQLLKAIGVVHAAHTAPAAARRRLDEYRVTDLLRDTRARASIGNRAVRAGNHRHACALHHLARGRLVTHSRDNARCRTHIGDSLVYAFLSKRGVFG